MTRGPVSVVEKYPALLLEGDLLVGDATKARTKLGWEPEVTFQQLVNLMVSHDLALEGRKLSRG